MEYAFQQNYSTLERKICVMCGASKVMKNYKLYTPDEKTIIGIKAIDGSIIPCTHINWATDGIGGQTFIYQIPDGSINKIPEKTILIDETGKQWSEIDILHSSIK